MTLGVILNPGKVTSRFNLHAGWGAKTFHYEAHCVIHEPFKSDEDLTGRHLIIDHLAGVEYILWLGGRQRTVHFILENAVLAVVEEEQQEKSMTKGQLKNYVEGMLNTELSEIQTGDPVNQAILDNVEVAFGAILDRARDSEDTCEDDEDEDEAKPVDPPDTTVTEKD